MVKLFKYSATFAFFILVQSVCAQQNKADSLLKLTEASVQDTVKIKAFCDLSYLSYQSGEYDKELEYGKRAFKLAQKINWKNGQAASLNRIGSAYDDIGEYSQALSYYFQALRIAMEVKAESIVAESYQNIGIIYLRKGSYAEALKNYLASLKIKTAIADKKGMGVSYNNIGLVYYYQGNYPEAIKNFLSSLTIEEAIGDVRGMGDSYNNIGSAYENLGNFDEALKNNQKALEIKKKLADKQGMAGCYNNIANIYFDRDQLGMALPNYEMTIRLSEETGDKKGLALGYSNLANVYDQLGNSGQAYAYQSDALFMRREIGDKQGIAVSEIALGELDLKLNRFESAEKRFKEGLRIAEEIGSWDNLRNGYQSLYRMESKRENWKSAYTNYRRYMNYKDSLFNEQRTKETVQNQMQYEFDKKEVADSIKVVEERKISNLKFEQEKKQRYYLYAGLGLVVVFAGFMFNRFKITEKQKRIIEIKERETQHQKEVVEEKQKEILDSIRYAKRIQKSLMPTEKYMHKKLTDLRAKFPLVLIAIFFFSFSFAQTQKIDSLLQHVRPNVQDTSQVILLNKLSSEYESAQNFSKSRQYAYKAILLAEKLKYKRGLGYGYFNLGFIDDFEKANDYQDRIKYLEKANALFIEIGDKDGSGSCYSRMGNIYEEYDYKLALKNYRNALHIYSLQGNKIRACYAYGNIGNVFESQGNFPEALKQYYTALKLAEELKDSARIAATYNNIGIIKMYQQDNKGAEQMYLKAINVKRKMNDTVNVHFSNMLDNLGIISCYLGDNVKAIKCMEEGLRIREMLNERPMMAASYENIGSLLRFEGKYDEARDMIERGYKIYQEIGDKKGMALSNVTIGQMLLDKDRPSEARKKYVEALASAKEIGHTSTIRAIYQSMAVVDSLLGDYENALLNYKLYITYRDSLFNEDNTRKSVEAQMKYEFDKKQTADSLRVAEERQINNLKFEQEKKQRYYLYTGLALVLVFAGFMFNRFKVTQRQKKIIEIKEREAQQQKEVVEEKQKEILDSIRYAKRIQTSLLPTEKYIQRKLNDLRHKMPLLLFGILLSGFSFSQQSNVDSLMRYVKPEVHDTAQVNVLNLLASGYEDLENFSRSRQYAYKALVLARELNYQKGIARAYFNIGYLEDFEKENDYLERIGYLEKANTMFKELGDTRSSAYALLRIATFYDEYDYKKALKNYFIALEAFDKIGDKAGIALAYGNMGNIYEDQGNFPEALKCFFTCLKLAEEMNDKGRIAAVYNNIGIVKMNQKEYEEGKKMYLKAVAVKRSINDTLNLHFANMLDNLGIINYYLGNNTAALQSMMSSLKIREELRDVSSMASSYGNIGVLYKLQKEYDKSMEMSKKALKLNSDVGDKKGMALTMMTIGDLLWEQKKYKEAKESYLKGLVLAKEIGHTQTLKSLYEGLATIDSVLGDHKSALMHYQLFIAYRDSLYNEENTKKSVEAQMKYEFDKKQTADSLKVAEERKINTIKLEQEKNQRYYLYVGLVLVVVFAGFMFNRFKVTQRQKQIIEIKEREAQHQKEVVEEKQKEILDSIRYAKRIQRSLLPTEKYIDRKIRELNRS